MSGEVHGRYVKSLEEFVEMVASFKHAMPHGRECADFKCRLAQDAQKILDGNK